MARPPKPVDTSTFTGRVAVRIRARREKLKLTVRRAAELAAVPVSTWYQIEDGKSLTLERLPVIAKTLGCSVRSLIPA